MKTCTSAFRATVGVALLIAVALPLCDPARAADSRETCRTESSPPQVKQKASKLGGLLSAARRAGVGNVLGSAMIGEGRAAEVAGAAAGMAIEGRDPVSAAAGIAGSGRTAQAAGAAASTVVELTRQALPGCGAAN